MLPWENLSIMRQEEVYRMPNIGSICLLFEQQISYPCSPSVDLCKLFYLVNPCADRRIVRMQEALVHFFNSQQWKGRAGSFPNLSEHALELETNDVFLYFGHGHGVKHVTEKLVEFLCRSPVAFLMGCCTAKLTVDGVYDPRGVSLNYLFGGSTCTIANLWEVSDAEILDFGVTVIRAWLNEAKNNRNEHNDEKGLASFLPSARSSNKYPYLIGRHLYARAYQP